MAPREVGAARRLVCLDRRAWPEWLPGKAHQRVRSVPSDVPIMTSGGGSWATSSRGAGATASPTTEPRVRDSRVPTAHRLAAQLGCERSASGGRTGGCA
jgi:hypothetical protein